MQEWKFAHIDSEECAKEIGVDYPSIALMRFFDNEILKIGPTNAEGGHTSLSEIESILTLRTNPEIINFSEDFIRLIMNEENTSVVLFTKNVNKDKIKPYYQEFKSVAH